MGLIQDSKTNYSHLSLKESCIELNALCYYRNKAFIIKYIGHIPKHVT